MCPPLLDLFLPKAKVISKLRGAGDRFGDNLSEDFTKVDAINLQTQKSPDRLPKFRSLVISPLCPIEWRPDHSSPLFYFR